MIEMAQGFSDVFRTAIGSRLVAGADSMFDMFADDAVMEFPFAPSTVPKRVVGKPAIVEYVNTLAGQFTFERFGEPSVQTTADPDLVVAEFEALGRHNATGEIYDQHYVSFIHTRGSYIVHYREYWNPLVFLRALHGSAAVDALVTGRAS